MTRLRSGLGDVTAEEEANVAGWIGLIDELKSRRLEAAEGGAAKARERHTGRGKLLARERVARLVEAAAGTG